MKIFCQQVTKMDKILNSEIAKSLESMRLPSYEDLPDIGLYLEQTVRFLSDCLSPIPGVTITSSMVGNYVKKGLIESPQKKCYSRDQLAYLLFIAIAKNVLSLEDVELLINIQKRSYDNHTAYEYFVREFENVMEYVFGKSTELKKVGVEQSDEKTMLRNTIIAVSYKIYLDKCFDEIHRRMKGEKESVE